MRPRKPLTAAAVAAALSTAFLVLPSTPASAVQPDHLVVLAGSPHFVAYADYPVPRKGHPDYTRGELHVYSAKGRDRDLGSGFGDIDPASAQPYRFSIVASTLTGYSAADPTHVEWWDLHANTRGLATLPSGSRWQGSAPGGWIIVAADNETVEIQSIDGTVTSYGQPLPSEVAARGSIATISGPTGVVSFGTKSGTAGYQAWDTPGNVTSLDFGASTGSAGLRCTNVTGVIVGCLDRPATGAPVSHLAVPLDGSAPRSFTGCSAATVALKAKLVWVCGRWTGHPRFATGSSSVSTSAVPTTRLPGVNALGSFVTVGPKQRALIAVHNSHAAVHVLVAIPSPIIRADDAALRAAAHDIAAQAVASGALTTAPAYPYPAQVLQAAADALIATARSRDPSHQPRDTRAIMGKVPRPLSHHFRPRPKHRHIRVTHSLAHFSHALPDAGSAGIGTHTTHGGASPAPFRAPDGVYVEPRLPRPANPTVSMIAIRAALQKLGQPYVWAAAGPSTFDCSGLVQWAYAHAGRSFIHFTGSQWNQARLIPARDTLPGDLILFTRLVGGRQDIHHVGIYLGAGWMINAPFTGQYVNIVKVPTGVAGVVRP